MFNFNDYDVMLAVHEAHHREISDDAYRHNLIRRIKERRPGFWNRLVGFRPALKVTLGVDFARECMLNPGVC